MAGKEQLDKAAIACHPIVDPIAGTICQVVQNSPEIRAKLKEANLQIWDESSSVYMGWCLAAAIKLHAGSLLAAPIVHFLLDKLKKDSPDLIRQVQSRIKTVGSAASSRVTTLRRTIAAILRYLLDEQVIIRDLRAVLEGLLLLRELHDDGNRSGVFFFRTPSACAPLAAGKSLEQLTVAELSQGARFALRSLALRYTVPVEGVTALSSLFFSPQVEQRLLDAPVHPLNHEEIQRIHQAVFTQVSRLPLDSNTSILVNQQIRTLVCELLSVEFPTIGILGIFELPPNLGGFADASFIDWPPDTPPA